MHLRCPDRLQDISTAPFDFHLLHRARFPRLLVIAEFWYVLGPEMIAERPGLPLQLLEQEASVPGCFGSRLFLPGQSAIPGTAFALSAGQRCNTVWFPPSHRVPSAFPETALCGYKTAL